MHSLKKNRAASFAAVTLVYISAAVLGVLLYQKLPFAWWANLLLADVAATVLTFVFSVIFGNASVYDPYWSVQPAVILTALACTVPPSLPRVLLLIAVWLWSVRLTANWAYTFADLTHQDWRYTMLHEKSGAFYPIVNFFGIHLIPTLVVYLCILPAAYAFIHEPIANPLFLLLLSICPLAVLLQGAADVQMHRYRRHRDAPFIRTGLWKHSRHPNYLAEILMWWGIALSVLALFPTAPYLLSGAIANTLLFLCISIPMADRRQARKEGFADYKRETRMLLPLPKCGQGKKTNK